MSTIKVDSVVNKSGDSESGINLGTNDTVKFDIAGSTKWTLNSSGNLFPSSTSQGICFGVTSDTASNRLEDYEEGTWTPTYAQGITSVTYSSQNAKYTKIGNIVHTYCTVSANGGTANSSGLIIGGLPFTTKNDSSYTTATHYVNAASSMGMDTRLITFPNTTQVYLYEQHDGGVSQITGSNVGNGVQLYFSLTYEADGG